MKNTPIGKSFYKMLAKDIESRRIKFNDVNFLAKREIPFAVFPDLITLNKKNYVKNVGKSYVTERTAGIFTDYIGKVFKEMLASDLTNAGYYCVLPDGSTDSAVIEQVLIYVLFMLEGTPQCKFLSSESYENANSEGVKGCINKAFERIGITNFSKK